MLSTCHQAGNVEVIVRDQVPLKPLSDVVVGWEDAGAKGRWTIGNVVGASACDPRQ